MKSLESLLRFNARAALARRNFKDFISYTKPDYEFNWHHVYLCQKLDLFAKGQIKKMMVFMPPQHGKSELATRRFPAYYLGLKPKTRIAICSYSETIASGFNRDIQRIIDDVPYFDTFPGTYLNLSNVSNDAHEAYLRNSTIFETVGHRGYVITTGVGGSLTSKTVDVGIIDDPFKDREEAMSLRIRDKIWSWYTDVFETRLHNESQQLLIMTRWHQDDLAGRILATSGPSWEVVSFQGIKERDMLEDPRNIGEALWPSKHSLERLEEIRKHNPVTFNSLYQQEPKPSSDALVFPEWSEYDESPAILPIYGMDFGFSNDPSTLFEVRIHKENMYVKELLYKKGLTTPQLDVELSMLIPKYSNISADCSDPRTIADLKSRGWSNIKPSIKGPDSIVNGINWIKGFKLFVHKDSHNLKHELLNYQWLMYGGTPTNVPIDSHNHGIDAIRYTKSIYRPHAGLNVTFHKQR
jgi:hypothetical protein